MELIGKVKVVMDEKTFPSGFTKREFVITTEEQYPNDIAFELLKDKSGLIASYRVGDRLKVFFDIRGREYQGKYFNSLVAWKLESASNESQSHASSPPLPAPPAPTSFDESAEDDLPF